MLEFQVKNNILEIKETLMGASRDKVGFTYYCLKTWTVCNRGDPQPFERGSLWPPADNGSIEWVIKHHLPKVMNPAEIEEVRENIPKESYESRLKKHCEEFAAWSMKAVEEFREKEQKGHK